MGKHLVLVGGGHAHLLTIDNLDKFIARGHRVTVIGPSDDHYYSGMGPGMLGGIYAPEEIRFETRKTVEKMGGAFVKGMVSGVDPKTKTVFLESGESLPYDVLSLNAGSYVPVNAAMDEDVGVFAAKPIEGLLKARHRIMDRCALHSVRVGVIGGGAAAVELAGNVWRLLSTFARHGFEISVFSKNQILERFPEKVRTAARRSLQRRSIRIFENSAAAAIKNGEIRLDSGKTRETDFVFLATGVKPSPLFARSHLPIGPDGGLLVNRYLQSTGFPEIFGGGDCIYFQNSPLEKVGVYAVRQNPVLLHNLMAASDGKSFRSFDPGGTFLLILNLGDGTGIYYKNGLIFGGRLAFVIKDYIDRRFMRRFRMHE
ncbi:MAG: FAD-dependent oxidoreductase [Pseudomonadota bacterium]